MKKLLLAAAVAASFVGSLAYAEDAKPDNEVSFNIGAVSDYRYRGISQTRLDPALQGGADYTHNPTGFYAGTWLSTIKWTKDAGGSGNVEWDIYAGKRGEIVKDISYDVGVLSYVYPSNGLSNVPGFANANTTEIYGQVGYGPIYAKYSHSVTNLFGFVNSKNSGYLDIGANVEFTPGYTLNLHAGHQTVKNNTAYAYTDWKVGVTTEYAGVTFSAAAVATQADSALYVTPQGKFTGKTSIVLSALKSF
ncbi:TorF family putative porin [Undibacterium sp. Rencai35W]|uniref:TorF family putative porin n=1 Tax=Undibacterium sp. Rencai35W TaxID=3413046 RepID=UPI003BF0C202